MHLWRRLLTVIILGCVAHCSARAAGPRIAILNFGVDEPSVRAAAGASNFVAVLQANLSSEFDLVERAEFDKAIQELKISSLSAGGANSLMIGKWARADIILRGYFFSAGGARKLSLEAINTANADVLAAREFELAAPDAISKGAAALLRQAIETRNAREKQIAVHVLYLRFTNPYRIWGVVDPALAALANTFATNQPQTHRMVRFPEPSATSPEADLALTGLVDADPDAFAKVADYYVWGTLQSEEPLSAEITIWDGHTKPVAKKFSYHSGAGDFSQKFVANILEAAARKPSGAIDAATRKAVADELFRYAVAESDKQLSTILYGPSERAAYAATGRLIDLVCLLDPANPEPRERRLYHRFTPVEDRYGPAVAAAEAWAAHVEKFGPETHHLIPDKSIRPHHKRNVTAQYLYWPARIFQILRGNPIQDPTAPGDLGDIQGAQLRNAWIDEFKARFQKIGMSDDAKATYGTFGATIVGTINVSSRMPTLAEDALLDAIEPLVSQVAVTNPAAGDDFDRARRLIALLLKKPVKKRVEIEVKPVRLAKLPRVSDVYKIEAPANAAQAQEAAAPLIRTPVFSLLGPPAPAPDIAHVGMPENLPFSRIEAICPMGDRIYCVVDATFGTAVEGESRDTSKLLGAARISSKEIFVTDGTNTLRRAFAEAGLLHIQSFATAPGVLWFTSSNRLGRLANHRLEFSGASADFGSRHAPLIPDGEHCLINTGDYLIRANVASGEVGRVKIPDEVRSAYGFSQALATEDYLVSVGGVLLDRKSGSWRVIASALPNELHGYYSYAKPLAAPDGAWFLTPGAIRKFSFANGGWRAWTAWRTWEYRSDADTLVSLEGSRSHSARAARITNSVPSRLVGSLNGIYRDGDFLWILAHKAGTNSAILLHPDSEKIAAHINFPYTRSMSAVEARDGHFWFATHDSGGLSHFATDRYKATPREKWISLRAAMEEIEAALKHAPATEQAAAHWFNGDLERARSLAAGQESVEARLIEALTFSPGSAEYRAALEKMKTKAAGDSQRKIADGLLAIPPRQ